MQTNAAFQRNERSNKQARAVANQRPVYAGKQWKRVDSKRVTLH